jgi:hypothetical protein
LFERTTFLGIAADVWFDGFLGALLGAMLAVLVAWMTARGQVRGIQRQLDNEMALRKRGNYERATAELIREFQAMADRSRVYASTRRKEAVAGRKDLNLYNDARREVRLRLGALGTRPIRETVQQAPLVFQRYSACFARSLLMEPAEAEVMLSIAAEKVIAYVDELVGLLFEDWDTEHGTTRRVELPTLN